MLVFIDMEYRHEILTLYREIDGLTDEWTLFSKDGRNAEEPEKDTYEYWEKNSLLPNRAM